MLKIRIRECGQQLQNLEIYNPKNMFGSFYNEGQRVIEKQGDLGEIWISGFSFAHDLQKLKKNHIFAVVSGVNLSYKYPPQFAHLAFNLNDDQSQKVGHVFRPAFEFIDEQRKKTNVLVHCAAGISRCSVILIAYLMEKYGWSFDKCLQKLQSARPCCRPNMGFTKQLQEHQKSLGIKN